VVEKEQAATYDLDGNAVLKFNSKGDIFKFPRPAIISPQGQLVSAVHNEVQLYDTDGILLENGRTSGCGFVIFTC
jgi:hypothetical protein